MTWMEKLTLYLSYPFVQYALLVGMLIALCSALLGVTLVLRRMSFLGDGLSHAAFGAMSLAAVVNLSDDMLLVLPLTVGCAVVLLCGGEKWNLQGDSAIAMVSVSALAIGYLLMNLFSSSVNLSGDVCTTLFGSTSILTLRLWEVWLCVGLSIAVVALFVLCYHKIFAVTFDETFAQATGMKVKVYRLVQAVVIGVVIVLAMNLVGSLLISALIVFPPLSAMRLFRSFRGVVAGAGVISVVCALAGILISVVAGTPVGSTVVAANLVVFLLLSVVGGVKG